jgi:protein SCO1
VRFLAIATLVFLVGSQNPARAGISKADLTQVEAAPQLNAALPLALSLQGEQGDAKPLQQWLGNTPSIWILADFTCQTLCGPIVSIVADALTKSGLRPGVDFRLIIAGLDPKDTAADATAMKDAQVGADGNLSEHTFFLRGTAEGIAELAKAFGFQAIYDRERDQFAHPAVTYVVTADGHIARALPGLALDPANLRLALVDAGQGKTGSWTDHVRLMCYGFDPASGVYTAAVGRILAGAGALTIIAIVLLILSLFRRENATQKL